MAARVVISLEFPMFRTMSLRGSAGFGGEVKVRRAFSSKVMVMGITRE